jgi:uncharacterized protein (DUF2225 family)
MWGPDIPIDINIDEIHQTLNPNEYEVVLCEGCGLAAVGSSEDGQLILGVPKTDEPNDDPVMIAIRWVSREEFMSIPSYV